jgi:toxin ParE1/3/4
MKTIRYAQLALRDLEEIADYSGRMWGAVQARRYIADIRDHVTGVAKGQAFCQKVSSARADLYRTRIHRHLIIVEITDSCVSVVRILHEAMDIPRHVTLSA